MNKKVLIVCLILVILAVVWSYFLFLNKQSEKTVEPEVVSDVVPTIDPEALGLTLESGSKTSCLAKNLNNQVRIRVDNTKDIKHLAWVVSYEADIPQVERVARSSDKVSQSFENESEVIPGEPFASEYGLLGTCSKNICRCDTGIEEVKLILKVTKTDGKVYQTEASKEL